MRGVLALPAWAGPAAVALAALAWCTAAGVADPTKPGSVLPACPFKTVTGWACPGCGSTRMLHTLVRGDLESAARYNIVALLMVPVLIWAWAAWASHQVGGPRVPTWRPSPRLLWVALACWGLFAVLRNVPIEPFTALRV